MNSSQSKTSSRGAELPAAVELVVEPVVPAQLLRDIDVTAECPRAIPPMLQQFGKTRGLSIELLRFDRHAGLDRVATGKQRGVGRGRPVGRAPRVRELHARQPLEPLVERIRAKRVEHDEGDGWLVSIVAVPFIVPYLR